MAKTDDYLDIILQTSKWFDKRKEQLQSIVDKKTESKILFQGKDGEKVELPDELKKGFFLGIQTALEVLGEFPVKINNTNGDN